MAYPLDHVRREVAYLAYHLHWALEDLLRLPHGERVEWVGQVSAINQAILDAQD